MQPAARFLLRIFFWRQARDGDCVENAGQFPWAWFPQSRWNTGRTSFIHSTQSKTVPQCNTAWKHGMIHTALSSIFISFVDKRSLSAESAGVAFSSLLERGLAAMQTTAPADPIAFVADVPAAITAVASACQPPDAVAEQIHSSDGGVENRATPDNAKRQERVAGLEARSATVQRQVSPTGPSEATNDLEELLRACSVVRPPSVEDEIAALVAAEFDPPPLFLRRAANG